MTMYYKKTEFLQPVKKLIPISESYLNFKLFRLNYRVLCGNIMTYWKIMCFIRFYRRHCMLKSIDAFTGGQK